jgi:hypothetical protein
MAKHTVLLLACFFGVLVDAELRLLVVPPEWAMDIVDDATKCGSGMRDSYLQIIKKCAGAAVPMQSNWRAHLVAQLEDMQEIDASARTAITEGTANTITSTAEDDNDIPVTRMLQTGDAGNATEATRRRLEHCSQCDPPAKQDVETCCLVCGDNFCWRGSMPGTRRLELKGNSNDVDNSDPPSRHLSSSNAFLEAEFELIRALPAVNQQCRDSLNAKCIEEFTQDAPFQAQCWGCDETTGSWMGYFVAFSVLVDLEG